MQLMMVLTVLLDQRQWLENEKTLGHLVKYLKLIAPLLYMLVV